MMWRVQEPYRFTTCQKHMLTIEEDRAPSTISMDWAQRARSSNSNASVGNGRIATEGEQAFLNNEYQASEGELSERTRRHSDKQYDNGNRYTHSWLDWSKDSELQQLKSDDQVDGVTSTPSPEKKRARTASV